MKIIDQNGRLFGKISVIDVLVILVAVFLAFALRTRASEVSPPVEEQPTETFVYTVYCRTIPDYIEGQILVGDQIYDADNWDAGCVGEIIDVQYLPGTHVTTFQDGTVCVAPVENSVDIVLTIRCDGTIVDGVDLANGVYRLGVNSYRNLYTRYVSVRGIITSVEK